MSPEDIVLLDYTVDSHHWIFKLEKNGDIVLNNYTQIYKPVEFLGFIIQYFTSKNRIANKHYVFNIVHDSIKLYIPDKELWT